MASGIVCMSSEVVVGGGVLSCKRGICLNIIQISSSSSLMCVPPRSGLKLKACSSSRDHVKEINNNNNNYSKDKKKKKNIKDKLKISGYSEESSSTSSSKKKMIEVCMGRKCKKSGAKALMEEIEKEVGIGVEVVECKCMGKCTTAPNVKIHAAA